MSVCPLCFGGHGIICITVTHLPAPHSLMYTPYPRLYPTSSPAPVPHILACVPCLHLHPTSPPAPRVLTCVLHPGLYPTSLAAPHVPTTLLLSFCWLSSLTVHCALECGVLNRLQCVGGLWGCKKKEIHVDSQVCDLYVWECLGCVCVCVLLCVCRC